MSERGSFVTEYIYCEKCFLVARDILEQDYKYLRGIVVPIWTNAGDTTKFLPIVAGKIGGLYPGEELYEFAKEIMPELAKRICHPLRVAVLAEAGEKIFNVIPDSVETTD